MLRGEGGVGKWISYANEDSAGTYDIENGSGHLQKEMKERWKELREQAAIEHDPAKFLAIIQELNDALAEKELRGENSPGGPLRT